MGSVRKTWVAVALALGCALTACGGGTRTNVQQKSVTTGQELMDLQQAYDQGIITKKEYDRKKKELLK